MKDTLLAGLALLAVALCTALSCVHRSELPPGHTEHIEPAAPATTTTAPTTTATTTTVYELPVNYPLTDEERDLVERVVMAEAGGEVYEGQLAVAQCILNACLLDDLRPAEAVKAYKYTSARPAPTQQVKVAVAAVFDDGLTVFDADVLYFYAPGLCRSDWHETQDYVTTIGCHRFFRGVKQ